MRILVLCHRLPYPPNKGDKIRSFQQIRHLSERHEIHLLSLADPDQRGVPDDRLREICSAVEVFPFRRSMARLRSLAGILGNRPLTLSYFRSARLERRLEALVASTSFDVLLVCGSAMAQYAEHLSGIPRLLDMVDVDSVKWAEFARISSWPKSSIWRFESRRLGRYEATLTRTFDRIVLTTSREVVLLRSISEKSTAFVVRNGVDVVETGSTVYSEAEAPTLVFVGQMSYLANVDGVVHFVDEILPRLRRTFPGVRFLIVGRSPSPDVVRLARTAGVTVTGEVDDVKPHLAEAWAFVAPLRVAQGVQNKVLEAMAMGVPTVISDRVMAGLEDGGFQPGRDILVASNPEQFVDHLELLLGDKDLRSRVAHNAREQLSKSYSWSSNLLVLEEHLSTLVEARPSLRSGERGRTVLSTQVDEGMP